MNMLIKKGKRGEMICHEAADFSLVLIHKLQHKRKKNNNNNWSSEI